MKSKQRTLLLAVMLAAPSFAFADSIPGHSAGAYKYVTFSEGFTSEQKSPGVSAECNFLFNAPKEIGLSTNSIVSSSSSEIAMREEGSVLGAGGEASGNSVNLVDFNGNNGASSDDDKGKGKGKGKQGGGSSNGNGATSGSGAPSPSVLVAEPGSQTLLLFGLAGAALVFYRRKVLTNAT